MDTSLKRLMLNQKIPYFGIEVLIPNFFTIFHYFIKRKCEKLRRSQPIVPNVMLASEDKTDL